MDQAQVELLKIAIGTVGGVLTGWFALRVQVGKQGERKTAKLEADIQRRADSLYNRVLSELDRSDRRYNELAEQYDELSKQYEALEKACRERDNAQLARIQVLVKRIQVLHPTLSFDDSEL